MDSQTRRIRSKDGHAYTEFIRTCEFSTFYKWILSLKIKKEIVRGEVSVLKRRQIRNQCFHEESPILNL